MKIELTEAEIEKLYRACMQRAHSFTEKAFKEGNDLRDTYRRLSDNYKALANKMLDLIAVTTPTGL